MGAALVILWAIGLIGAVWGTVRASRRGDELVTLLGTALLGPLSAVFATALMLTAWTGSLPVDGAMLGMSGVGALLAALVAFAPGRGLRGHSEQTSLVHR